METEHRVVRRELSEHVVEVALVRYVKEVKRLAPDRMVPAETLASRRFKKLDLFDITTYEGQLDAARIHADAGRYGCVVEVGQERPGVVRVQVVERLLHGDRLRTEIHATREFDAAEEAALVASAELAAELRVWSEERNEARAAREREQREEQAARDESAAEKAAA